MSLRIKQCGTALILFISMFSCKSYYSTETVFNAPAEKTQICPAEGSCNFSILPNTAMLYKQDEFGIGYAEFIKEDATLLKFEYRQNEAPNTVDGHYIERIYLTVPKHVKALDLKDEHLKSVNLLFERLCYCKGQTGFYIITQGTLSLKILENNRCHLKLNFKTSEVPQRITFIDEIFDVSP